ncbi:MAG: RtcB family protein [Nanoarchaeota archaeon]
MLKNKTNKITENIYELPKSGKMNVPVEIFASEILFSKIKEDKTLEQAKNMAMMQGVVEKVVVLPDAHQGYGACIGGVSAYDLEKGVISPGQCGYDINCGVRLLVTNLTKSDFLKKRTEVLNEIYKNVPSGVGKESDFKLTINELDDVLNTGINWALKNGYASKEDIERIEDNGCLQGADASKVSQRAKARGKNQLGSLGSGNHFIELQEVESIFNEKTAKILGIKDKQQIVIMVHSGSRGLGHQTCSDYVQKMEKEYGFEHLPDRELACAPINSKLGQEYRSAMNAAANFAFVNRQLITHQIRKAFSKFFPKSKLDLVYDITHNIVKFEEHKVKGKSCTLCVHRKGATRSFGPGRKEIPAIYRKIGCPIFIPGSMGTFSYVLIGTKKAEELSFGSTAHGAGRVMSRSYAINNLSEKKLEKEMSDKDVLMRVGSMRGALEEAPEVYKDIDEVVRVSDELGIGQLVARLKPLAVVKG